MIKTKIDATTEGGPRSGDRGAGPDGGQFIAGRSASGLESGLEGPKGIPAMIRGLLRKVESKIGEGDLKALGDYLKLVQMLKELEEDEPREIKVTWIEKPPKTDSGK